LRNFNSLYGWIEGNLSGRDKVKVYRYYLKILDSTRGNKDPATGEQCGHIPTELEDLWRQSKDILSLSGKFLCKDQKARLMGDEMLEEAATPRIANLGNDDIIALIDLILGKESVLDVSEKLAGQNLSVKVENGQVYTKYKNQPEYREAYEPFKSIFAAHDGDGEYVFEMISPDDRPDYVNYLTDNTIFVDFSGRLTDEMAKKLSNESNTFMTKKQIRRNQFDVTPEQRQELVGLGSRAEQRLTSDDKKEIAERIKAIILSPNVQSVLGGGIEGLYVTGGEKNFKIPSPTYQKIQLLQASIYAYFRPRAKIRRSVLKQRMIEDKNNDKVVQNLRDFFSFAQNDIPSGYRMFVSPEEAMNLLSKMDTPEGRLEVYKFMIKRVKNRKNWYSRKQVEEAKKWSRKYKRSINCSSPKGFSQKQYCKRQERGGKYKS
jgi:DNA-directed RNA polymerase subunit F